MYNAPAEQVTCHIFRWERLVQVEKEKTCPGPPLPGWRLSWSVIRYIQALPQIWCVIYIAIVSYILYLILTYSHINIYDITYISSRDRHKKLNVLDRPAESRRTMRQNGILRCMYYVYTVYYPSLFYHYQHIIFI